MNEQLPLIGSDDSPWVIDPHTRQVGLEGLRQARAALAVGRAGHRPESQDPGTAQPTAA